MDSLAIDETVSAFELQDPSRKAPELKTNYISLEAVELEAPSFQLHIHLVLLHWSYSSI